MAADITFDLWGLLVENIFGSVLATGIAFVVFIAIIGLIGRFSPTLLLFWILTFGFIFSVGYLGGLVYVLAFLLGGFYFIHALSRTILNLLR